MKRYLPISLYVATVVCCHAWDTPTMGWSSWNTYRNNISEDLIRQQARIMSENGLREAGYRYVNIDDGAFSGRDTVGNLNINPERFPNGLKELVEYIHSLNLRAGTYSDAGRNTCASFYDNDTGGAGTGLYGHDAQDIQFLFGDLGFDFIKVDFCGGDPAQNTEQLDLDERQRYTEVRQAIDVLGRDDVRFNVCRWNYPGTWVEEVATSWRISEDIWPGWESVKGIIAQNLYLSAYASEGRFNDMDMLEVGRGMTGEEDKTHFGMWCMMSSPLLIGCDLTGLTEETMSLLTNPELIALNQDTLALQAYVARHTDDVYVLVKDIRQPYSETRAVAIYNPTDTDKDVSLAFGSIDLGGKVTVRDVFDRCDMGVFEEFMTVALAPHSTRIYTLTAEKRFERQRYEAETGRLSAYQEIMNHHVAKSAIYEADSICSGGMKASCLGMRSDNDIQWRNVYSESGGDYLLTVAWTSPEERSFRLDVNGVSVPEYTLTHEGSDRVCTTEFSISLNPGENIVRLYNESDRMPDIDYIEIKSARGV